MYNPNHSASWYPGKGIYRNVSLTKTAPVHVAQWGTFTTTPQVSAKETTIHLSLKLEINQPQHKLLKKKLKFLLLLFLENQKAK